MMRDLHRRLSALELAGLADIDPVTLTDEHRAAFVALDCLVLATLLGGFQPGDDPMDALHRGIEKAFASNDRLSPIRAGFAQRLKDASSMALNGNESVAVPQDRFERSRVLLDGPHAGMLMAAFSGVFNDYAGFADPARDAALGTRIDADGSEHYCWPDRARAVAPDRRWRGQGLEAARTYWAGRSPMA